jgi:O-acetylhomoserine/O-acetylserine sulfhydrylase-like pyridoxal-dependent enzyme
MTSMEKGFATTAIHAGQDPHQWTHRALVPPLVMSTTFQQDAPAQHSVSVKCINDSSESICM